MLNKITVILMDIQIPTYMYDLTACAKTSEVMVLDLVTQALSRLHLDRCVREERAPEILPTPGYDNQTIWSMLSRGAIRGNF